MANMAAWRALPLVSRGPEGALAVGEVAASALERLETRRTRVLGAFGARGGCARLLLRSLLSPVDEAGEGDGGDADVLLWLWLPVEDGGGEDCRVVVSTELRDGEGERLRSARLALLLLLSSAVLYSDDGEVDAAAVERLRWLEDVPRCLRIKPTQDEESIVSDFHRHAPAFLWIAHNFKVKWLTGSDGSKMTPTEYLDSALAEEGGYSDAVGARNALRMYMTAFFKSRDCVPLSRATDGAAASDTIPSREDLRPQFVEVIDKLYGSLLANKSTSSQLPVKRLMNTELDALQLKTVIEVYVAALNAGQLPAIQNASTKLLEKCVDEAMQAASEVYSASCLAETNTLLLTRELQQNHLRGLQAAEAKLLSVRSTLFADTSSQSAVLEKQFDEGKEKWILEIEAQAQEQFDSNLAQSAESCRKLLDGLLPPGLEESIGARLHDTPREIFADGLVESLTHYKTDLATALASYKERGEGSQVAAVLEKVLQQKVSPSVQRFGEQVLEQLERHLASWQEQKQQLERDLEAAKAQDAQVSVSAEDQKRLYEEQLAQSTGQLSEMRSMLQGELNAKKSELERLTSDLTTMNLKHEVRVKNAESDLDWARRRTEEMEADIRNHQQRQLELQLQGQNGEGGATDDLLQTERVFHQEERNLLTQQKELMDQIVKLQRELVQKKTNHVQRVFGAENEHAKQVDDARAAHAEFARQLRAQAKSDLAMLRLAHQRKKTAAQTQLAELDEQVADLRARLTACPEPEKPKDAASSSSSRDLFRTLSMSLSAAVGDSKSDSKSSSAAETNNAQASTASASGEASSAGTEQPKPRDTSMCAQS